MPWCDSCERYLTPTGLDADGTCPSCDSGSVLAKPRAKSKLPWHFWLILIATGVYLGWRAVEGVVWAVGRF
jgi:hypothetical protein